MAINFYLVSYDMKAEKLFSHKSSTQMYNDSGMRKTLKKHWHEADGDTTNLFEEYTKLYNFKQDVLQKEYLAKREKVSPEDTMRCILWRTSNLDHGGEIGRLEDESLLLEKLLLFSVPDDEEIWTDFNLELCWSLAFNFMKLKSFTKKGQKESVECYLDKIPGMRNISTEKIIEAFTKAGNVIQNNFPESIEVQELKKEIEKLTLDKDSEVEKAQELKKEIEKLNNENEYLREFAQSITFK